MPHSVLLANPGCLWSSGMWPSCPPCPTQEPKLHSEVAALAYSGPGASRTSGSWLQAQGQANPSMACHRPLSWNNKASALWSVLPSLHFQATPLGRTVIPH